MATARRERPESTLEQVRHAFAARPNAAEIEGRSRALAALVLLTGARDVATKLSDGFTTYFIPCRSRCPENRRGLSALPATANARGNGEALFPASHIEFGVNRYFEIVGIDRKPWSFASPVRAIFNQSFEAARLRYFSPHSFRRLLAQFGETICQTPRQSKAWSHNLAHEGVLTTF